MNANNEGERRRRIADEADPQGSFLPPNFPFVKAIVVMFLLLTCFVLQVCVWSLDILIEVEDQARKDRLKTAGVESSSSHTGTPPTTLHSSQRFLQHELYTVQRMEALQHESVPKSATAYWNQAVASGILDWEYDIDDLKKQSGYQTIDLIKDGSWSTTEGWNALERAAQLGHPRAQLYIGNSVASGFSFVESVNTDERVRISVANDTSAIPALASLYWHTAAVNYNVEAALNMADQLTNEASATSTASTIAADCSAVLPYRAAAAHATIDNHPHPRFTVRTDKHRLYQLHARSSGHSADNRPDESPETLQFFALRAAEGPDKANAAYTLGRYYHVGIRGTPVNATAAAQYYRQAAEEGHWAAAGQAGMLYLWGWGVAANASTAYELFQQGVPDGYDVCVWKVKEKLMLQRQQKKSQADAIYPCDDTSLNGLGLLYVLGGPVEVDLDQAEKYFALAKDQGNPDAAYNSAMMKLGWKTHYQALLDRPDSSSATQEEQGQEGKPPKRRAQDLFPVNGKPFSQSSPTLSEYKEIVKDLTTAAMQGNHLLARHRLALLYEHGVTVQRKPSTGSNVMAAYHVAIPRDCVKAAGQYQAIVDAATPGIVKRMRRAYEYYTAGDWIKSLNTYLVVAATGHELAQVNAAFLFEQGVCLGLPRTECAKAAVRLWKAAADQGSAEASLRVGDFYYYGRFRQDTVSNASGPFAWVQCVLYPEEHLVPWLLRGQRQFGQYVAWRFEMFQSSKQTIRDFKSMVADMLGAALGWTEMPPVKDDDSSTECVAQGGESNGVCLASTAKRMSDNSLDPDLQVAARYYRLAAERNSNPRALYNLGFMYQFGLGLKRDFPLAKRQFDSAIVASGRSGEANVPVALALYFLSCHEYVLKLGSRCQSALDHLTVPVRGERIPKHLLGKSRLDIMRDHLLSFESLLVLVLTVVVSVLLSARQRWTHSG